MMLQIRDGEQIVRNEDDNELGSWRAPQKEIEGEGRIRSEHKIKVVAGGRVTAVYKGKDANCGSFVRRKRKGLSRRFRRERSPGAATSGRSTRRSSDQSGPAQWRCGRRSS